MARPTHRFLEQPTNSAASVKFGLYVKNRELKEISKSLKHIALLPTEERLQLADEYEEMLADTLESFVEETLYALEGLQFDREALDLSVELVTNLREVMHEVQGILSAEDSLISD